MNNHINNQIMYSENNNKNKQRKKEKITKSKNGKNKVEEGEKE